MFNRLYNIFVKNKLSKNQSGKLPVVDPSRRMSFIGLIKKSCQVWPPSCTKLIHKKACPMRDKAIKGTIKRRKPVEITFFTGVFL